MKTFTATFNLQTFKWSDPCKTTRKFKARNLTDAMDMAENFCLNWNGNRTEVSIMTILNVK